MMNTTTKSTTTEIAKSSAPSLVVRFAEKYGIEDRKLLETLRATAFKIKGSDQGVSDHQMMALLVVAEQYKLNPFTKEIFAFPDKQSGIVPVVSVDGWSRIINEHPQLNGVEFRYSESMINPNDTGLKGMMFPAHEWIECVIYRKDREYPIVIREYFEEVYRPPFEGKGNNGTYTVNGPWQTHGKRMHRHKALIQGSRIAFGFAGIYDEDEAMRILEAQDNRVVHTIQGTTRAEQARNAIGAVSKEPIKTETTTVVSDVKPVEKTATSTNEKQTAINPNTYVWLLDAVTNEKELRDVWDAIIDNCIELDIEVPADIESKFNSLLAKYTK